MSRNTGRCLVFRSQFNQVHKNITQSPKNHFCFLPLKPTTNLVPSVMKKTLGDTLDGQRHKITASFMTLVIDTRFFVKLTGTSERHFKRFEHFAKRFKNDAS